MTIWVRINYWRTKQGRYELPLIIFMYFNQIKSYNISFWWIKKPFLKCDLAKEGVDLPLCPVTLIGWKCCPLVASKSWRCYVRSSLKGTHTSPGGWTCDGHCWSCSACLNELRDRISRLWIGLKIWVIPYGLRILPGVHCLIQARLLCSCWVPWEIPASFLYLYSQGSNGHWVGLLGEQMNVHTCEVLLIACKPWINNSADDRTGTRLQFGPSVPWTWL